MTERQKPDWLKYGKQIGEAIKGRERQLSPWEREIERLSKDDRKRRPLPLPQKTDFVEI